MSRTAALLAVLALAACAAEAPTVTTSASADWPPPSPALTMPEPMAREYTADDDAPQGVWRIRPISAPVEHGAAYSFTLRHCGLGSPIDFDGSFWDPVEAWNAAGVAVGLDAHGDLINATPGTMAVLGDEARFRSESGVVVRLVRHDGAKDHGICF